MWFSNSIISSGRSLLQFEPLQSWWLWYLPQVCNIWHRSLGQTGILQWRQHWVSGPVQVEQICDMHRKPWSMLVRMSAKQTGWLRLRWKCTMIHWSFQGVSGWESHRQHTVFCFFLNHFIYTGMCTGSVLRPVAGAGGCRTEESRDPLMKCGRTARQTSLCEQASEVALPVHNRLQTTRIDTWNSECLRNVYLWI